LEVLPVTMGGFLELVDEHRLARDEKKDLEDFRFLITKMHELGEGFGGVVLADEDGEDGKPGSLEDGGGGCWGPP
jgi:hypothetical protein